MAEFVELSKKGNDANRRWFMASDLDLIVFYDENDEITGFQFCYDKNQHEQMLSWNKQQGYSHMAIDDGDTLSDQGHKRTPLIVPNGSYSLNIILEKLDSSGGTLPPEVSEFVKTKLQSHPEYEQAKHT